MLKSEKQQETEKRQVLWEMADWMMTFDFSDFEFFQTCLQCLLTKQSFMISMEHQVSYQITM